LAATIASVQLDTLDQRLQDRRVNCEQLSNGLTGIPGVQPMFAPSTCEPAYHCYSPTFVPEEVEGVPRELYTAALEAEGVPIHCGFVGQPLHLRPLFRQRSYGVNGWPWRTANSRRRYRRGDCPVAEARCSQLELGIDANWGGKKSAWIAQIVDAFTKVAEHIEALRAVAREGAGGEQTARRGARVRAIGSQPTWSSWVDAEFS
jgi:dTDP-4-amino-4,6-dideoxygalactose transaminase